VPHVVKDTPEATQLQQLLDWIDEQTGGALRRAVEKAGAEYADSEGRLHVHADLNGKCSVRARVDGVEVYRLEYTAVSDDQPAADLSKWTFHNDAPGAGVA
jgi:hypothetical protein